MTVVAKRENNFEFIELIQLGPKVASVLIDLFSNGLQRDLFHLGKRFWPISFHFR